MRRQLTSPSCRSRWSVAVVVAIGVLCGPGRSAVAQAPASAVRQPPFRTETSLVTVDAVVVDGHGTPVTGLSAADFEILDEGTPQTIEVFQAVAASAETPAASADVRAASPFRYATNVGIGAGAARTFVLLFDDLHLSREQGRRARAALESFVRGAAADGDLLSLVVPGSGLRWHARLPQGRDELLRIIEGLEGRVQPEPTFERLTDYEAYRVHVFQDEAVADQVDRRWKSFGVLGREPSNLATDRGFQPQERAGMAGLITPDIAIRAADAYSRVMARNRVTLGALRSTVDALAAVRGRKSVVWLSAGIIEDHEQVDARQVRDAARRANVALYFIDARGLEAGSAFSTAQFGSPLDHRDVGAAVAQIELEAQGTENLALDTGGFSVRNANDVSGAVTRVARESSSYYLLGFQPTADAAPGKYRRLEVRARRPAVQVRARRGYVTGPRPTDDATSAPLGADVLQRATDAPFELDAIPLRVASYVFGQAEPGRVLVTMAVEADLRAFAFSQAGQRLSDVLELRIAATHLESSRTERYDQHLEMVFPAGTTFGEDAWHGLARDFVLTPGRYQARVAVRDRASGRVGAVTHAFDVPDVEGFRVTTPIVTDVVQSAEGGPPVPVLVVRRTFPAGATLYYQFTVSGAAAGPTGPQVEASHEIRAADGRVVRTMAPRAIEAGAGGVLRRLSGLVLRGEPAGTYELVLRVTDKVAGRTIELREPFALLPPAR